MPSRRPEDVEAEVAALGGLTLAVLRDRWRALFGNPPPKSLRRAFLIKACAYQIQVYAYGGLSAATKRRLRRIAEAARTGAPIAVSSPKIKPGTRLVRAWGGKVHTVTALEGGGFEYEGERFRSLSAIAGKITGTNWNGRAFFGLKAPSGESAARARYERPEARSGDRTERGAVSAQQGGKPPSVGPAPDYAAGDPQMETP